MNSIQVGQALPIEVVASAELPIALLKRIRADLATRAGRQADAAADYWSDLPPWFKRAALARARLDPLRECMPWKSFDRTERIALVGVALELHRHALSLERIGRS